MNVYQAQQAIETKVASLWPANLRTASPGVPFTPQPSDEYWLKLDIIWGDGALVTKDFQNEGVNQIVGVLQLQVYERRPRTAVWGDGALMGLVESFLRVFLSRSQIPTGTGALDGVRTGAASGIRMTFEESWRVATVSIPFSFYELVIAF